MPLANSASDQEMREPTFGEKAVGLTFNPEGHPEVNEIKRKCADLVDALNDMRQLTDNGDKKRMFSEAITCIQAGQMWGVKAVTWKY